MKKISKNKFFHFDQEDVAIFFLGVGLTMFLLNITTILNMMLVWNVAYSLTSYYVSTASAMLIILYAVHNLYSK